MTDTLTTWTLRGYQDWQERRPWKRAPYSESQFPETPEEEAYWSGWKAGATDTYAKACRERKES